MNSVSGVVTFVPLGRSAPARPDETILDVARSIGAPLGNSCGGTGICARCRITVVAGAESISPPTTIEARVILERGLGKDERLACQAIVKGACSVTTGYW